MNAALLVLLLSTQTCDFVTTNVALSQGYVEANPVLKGSRTRINTIKASVDILAVTTWYRNRKKPSAKVIPIAMSIAGGAACAWNLKELAK